MPVRIDSDTVPPRIVLEGVVTIEETDLLLEAFARYPGIGVDLSACEHLHTAPLQLLKFRKTPLLAEPKDPFWIRCLEPFEQQEDTVQTVEEQDNTWGLFD